MRANVRPPSSDFISGPDNEYTALGSLGSTRMSL
jgi:hypothetical protein